MATTYTADVTVRMTITFEDDGERSLVDQAYEAIWDHNLDPFADDAEVKERHIKPVEVPA